MTSAVVEAWQQLAAEGRSEPGWHGRRIYALARTPIHAALRQPGATKGLLLEVKARSMHPSNTFPSSSGFDVDLETVAPGPNGSLRICLELADARYDGVFEVLADDVASAVAAAGSEPAGIAALIGRLNTWQRFLRRHGDGLLSEQEQVGLFAELIVFRELLSDGLSAADAVDAWRGPWGGAQDFRLVNCSVEVKATASAASNSFEVSNLSQLDERPLPSLIVRHLALSRADGLGETLPEIVDAIGRLITSTDPSALGSFADGLLEAGYSQAHRPDYRSAGFSILSDRQFRVHADFPRLRPDEVRGGVAACSYSVQLSACLPFMIDAASALRIVRGARHD